MKEKKLNIFGTITRYFLYNRPLTILIFLLSIFLGVLAYNLTPKQYNPEINLPVFQVHVNFPGATAEEVEEFVTRELEEKIADIPGVDEIRSVSLDGGSSMVTVEFKIGEDLEESKVKLRTQLAGHLDLRIGTIGNPLIKNLNPDNVPIVTIGFYSEVFSQNEIRKEVINIMNEMKKIRGVANLEVHGGEKRALKIFLDPAKMKYKKVSVTEVKNAIKQNNIHSIVGEIENDKYRQEIEVSGVILSKHEAENIIINPGIKLGDISEVIDAYREKSSYVQLHTKEKKSQDAVFLSIAKRKGENGVLLSKEILEKLQNLYSKSYTDSGISYEIFRNAGEVADKEIKNLGKNLITSIAIVSILLVFFLGVRTASIVAIAIPLTLSLVFFIAYIFDQTINRITLFALILSLGLLVDAATVVTENIHRHLSFSAGKKDVIVKAVNEVGIGLFLSVLTSIIVFLPLTQVTGMMGAYMGPLAFFVPVALLMSLFVAYILSPFLAKTFLKRETGLQSKDKKFHIFSLIKIWFPLVQHYYTKILTKILESKKIQKRFLSSVFIILFIVLSFPFFELVHFRMLPKADKNQYYIYIDEKEGTDIEKMNDITQEVISVILDDSYTQSIQSFSGIPAIIDFNGLFKGGHLRGAQNLSTLRVNILPREKRKLKSEDIVKELRKKVIKHMDIKNLYPNIRFMEDPPGPPVLATLVAKVQGPETKMREQIVQDLKLKFEKTLSLRDIKSNIEHPKPRIIYSLDHKKALDTGIKTHELEETLRLALQASQVSQFHIPDLKEMAFIELQFKKEDRNEVQDMTKIYVKNHFGEMVPIDSIVKKIDTKSEVARYLDEREETNYITAELEDRSVIYAVIDLIKDLRSYEFADGGELKSWDLFSLKYENDLGENYEIRWGGEWEMTLKNFRDLGLAMLVAFFLVYFVLVMQFRSFKAPSLIMATVPLGLIGIILGFSILDFFGVYLTATALIGFIALIGIVVNNAIIYFEYLRQLLFNGVELKSAIIKAGQTRLRPIILTSMTTVLGSLTIASDPVWSGLAWSIVFGLSLSAALTLIVFPVLYYRLECSKPEKKNSL